MKKTLATILVSLLLLGNLALADPIDTGTGYLDPSNARYSGFVYDLDSGLPVPDVCVYAGPAGCPNPAVRTDARGHWAIDFPKGFSWDFHFDHPAYYATTIETAGTRTVVILAPISGYSSGSKGFTLDPK